MTGSSREAQLEFTDPLAGCHPKGCDTTVAPAGATVNLQVNGGQIFSFFEPLPEQNDFAFIGFDEDPGSEDSANLISSVRMWVDPSTSNVSFPEVKQIGWSVCSSGGGCGPMGAPEPSTWAMMLLGFAGLGFAGYRKAKNARFAFSAG